MERFRGTAASAGITVGPAYVVDARHLTTPRYHIPKDTVDGEAKRLQKAVAEADRQFERIKARLHARFPAGGDHYGILEAHQLMLHDERLLGATERLIAEEAINAEWALQRAVDAIKAVFDEIDDPYFRERRNDVDFVAQRVLRSLLGQSEHRALPMGSIVVARDLSPADAALFWRMGALAFAVDAGSAASHTSIVVRSLQMPTVVGLERLCDQVGNGDILVIDGTRGEVVVNPSPEVVSDSKTRGAIETATEQAMLTNRDLPACTVDGHRITLFANIELPEEIQSAIDHGAEGIGLFRTEFLFMNRNDLPTEDEHCEHATVALQQLAGRPATFRTFDLGGEKLATTAPVEVEPNPALGLRSIRLCLKERAMFRSQLRGLLRASTAGPMRILFPMITGMDELRAVREVLDEAMQSLAHEAILVSPLQIGVMVETPSAVAVADLLAKEADFLSIGTNDLIQYSLAVDRSSEQVTHLYDPYHPAIFRMVRDVIDRAHSAGICVNVCGEIAGYPNFAVLLAGLGVDELSMNVGAIPHVKRALRAWRMSDARLFAKEVLGADSSVAVRRILHTRP